MRYRNIDSSRRRRGEREKLCFCSALGTYRNVMWYLPTSATQYTYYVGVRFRECRQSRALYFRSFLYLPRVVYVIDFLSYSRNKTLGHFRKMHIQYLEPGIELTTSWLWVSSVNHQARSPTRSFLFGFTVCSKDWHNFEELRANTINLTKFFYL